MNPLGAGGSEGTRGWGTSSGRGIHVVVVLHLMKCTPPGRALDGSVDSVPCEMYSIHGVELPSRNIPSEEEFGGAVEGGDGVFYSEGVGGRRGGELSLGARFRAKTHHHTVVLVTTLAPILLPVDCGWWYGGRVGALVLRSSSADVQWVIVTLGGGARRCLRWSVQTPKGLHVRRVSLAGLRP